MTVAATLAVSARAEGFIPRLNVMFATPVVEIDGEAHPIPWLHTHRFVLAPGQHVVRLWFRRHQSTAGHTSVPVSIGPGETVELVATLGRGGFSTDVGRARPPEWRSAAGQPGTA